MLHEARRVLAAEWLKARKLRGTYVGIGIYLLVVLIMYFTVHLAVSRSFMGIKTGFFMAGAALSATVTPLEFVGVLLVAFSLAREFSSGTINLAWARPLSRRGWLLGKSLGTIIHLKIFLAITIILVVAGAWAQFGYSSLMEKEYLIHSEASLWWSLLIAVTLTWIALIAVIIYVEIAAMYIGNPGGTIAACVAAGFVLQMAARWEPLTPYMLPTYLMVPLDQFQQMAKGLPLPYAWSSLFRMCLLGSAAWIIGGWLWASWLVKKKEVLG